MIRRPPRSTLDRSSAASDVYKRIQANCSEQQSEYSERGEQQRAETRRTDRFIEALAHRADVDDGEPAVERADQLAHRRHECIRIAARAQHQIGCLLYTSPSPRDRQKSRMPSS